MRLQVDLDNRQFLSKTPTRQTAFLQQRFALFMSMAFFILESHNSPGRTWANIFPAAVKFVYCKDGHKTHYASGRSIHFRRTKLVTSSRRIMLLVPVFILDEFNRRRKNVCPRSSQTNCASRIVCPVFTLDG